jgi:N-acetylglutamate synthase-like GNAT family acetyltransferase
MKEIEAKKLLANYLDSWIKKDKTIFLSCLSDNIIYSECYGPIYRDKSSCEKWFDNWNQESKVNKWEISNFAFDDKNDKLAFEWLFECNYKGEVYRFNGSSFITIRNGVFATINEYKTESNHYYPYEYKEEVIKEQRKIDISSSYKVEYKWPTANDLLLLLKQAPWAKNRSYNEIITLVDNSDFVVSIYDLNNQLIGFGRIISDGKYRGLLDDIIVDEKHRRKGIGRYIVDNLIMKAEGIEEIFLNTGKDHQKFYENCSFTLFNGITMIRRQNEKKESV